MVIVSYASLSGYNLKQDFRHPYGDKNSFIYLLNHYWICSYDEGNTIPLRAQEIWEWKIKSFKPGHSKQNSLVGYWPVYLDGFPDLNYSD